MAQSGEPAPNRPGAAKTGLVIGLAVIGGVLSVLGGLGTVLMGTAAALAVTAAAGTIAGAVYQEATGKPVPTALQATTIACAALSAGASVGSLIQGAVQTSSSTATTVSSGVSSGQPAAGTVAPVPPAAPASAPPPPIGEAGKAFEKMTKWDVANKVISDSLKIASAGVATADLVAKEEVKSDQKEYDRAARRAGVLLNGGNSNRAYVTIFS